MADMMKMMGGASAKRGMMGKLGQMMGLGGGMPMPSPDEIAALQKQMGGAGAGPARRPARHPRRPAARRFQPAAAIPGPRRRREASRPRRRLQSVRREEEVTKFPFSRARGGDEGSKRQSVCGNHQI